MFQKKPVPVKADTAAKRSAVDATSDPEGKADMAFVQFKKKKGKGKTAEDAALALAGR